MQLLNFWFTTGTRARHALQQCRMEQAKTLSHTNEVPRARAMTCRAVSHDQFYEGTLTRASPWSRLSRSGTASKRTRRTLASGRRIRRSFIVYKKYMVPVFFFSHVRVAGSCSRRMAYPGGSGAAGRPRGRRPRRVRVHPRFLNSFIRVKCHAEQLLDRLYIPGRKVRTVIFGQQS